MLNGRSRHAQRGESLVSLMIGLALGLVVVSGAVTMFFSATRNLNFALNASQLDQEMQTVMELMVRDIQRAQYSSVGFRCANSSSCSDPFSTGNGAFTLTGSGQLQYASDLNTDGTLQSNECSGFRVATVGGKGELDKVTACPAGVGGTPTWSALTDSAAMNVSTLAFNVATSCLANPNAGGSGYLVVRDVQVYLAASMGGVNRHLCQKVHVSNDAYASTCTASSFSTANPFTGCPP